jgi:hypothetical protein
MPFALKRLVMPQSHDSRQLTIGGFAAVYLAALAAATVITVALDERFDVDAEQTVLVFLGGLFVLASSGRPWWLFQTVRTLRWFSFVRSDVVLRTLLFCMGLAAAALGFFVDID